MDNLKVVFVFMLAGKKNRHTIEMKHFNNIEDQIDNTTRFIVVGREEVAPSGGDKTSIMVSMENKPGALFKVLEPFHRAGVSLTSIETRPSKAGKWSYVFFIDFDFTRPQIFFD